MVFGLFPWYDDHRVTGNQKARKNSGFCAKRCHGNPPVACAGDIKSQLATPPRDQRRGNPSISDVRQYLATTGENRCPGLWEPQARVHHRSDRM
jgi:hypothetical protein